MKTIKFLISLTLFLLSRSCESYILKSLNILSKKAFTPTSKSPLSLLSRVDNKDGQRISSSRLSAFSLDSAVLPANSPIFSPFSSALVILASTFLAFYNKQIPTKDGDGVVTRVISTLFNGIFTGVVSIFGSATELFGRRLGLNSKGLVPGLVLFFRIVMAKIMMFVEYTVKSVVDLGNDEDEPELIGRDDWSICTLSERESLSSRYVKYRFELEDPSAKLPLEVGQEVLLCTVDSQNRVFKEPFFPLSPTSARGYFDVVLRRERDSGSDKFSKALETLALGDEIALKTGKMKLNYIGNDDEITDITVVASGMGIIPAINILRGILPGSDSTIEDIKVLWINEDKGDFFCNNELEKLEYRYFERLAVKRILENDLYAADLSKVNELKDQFSPYESGKIAIICGPDYVISKSRSMFYDMEYPTTNIMSIQNN